MLFFSGTRARCVGSYRPRISGPVVVQPFVDIHCFDQCSWGFSRTRRQLPETLGWGSSQANTVVSRNQQLVDDAEGRHHERRTPLPFVAGTCKAGAVIAMPAQWSLWPRKK